MAADAPPIVRCSSRISAVTVFANHAEITRIAAVGLKVGSNRVAFDDLPAHVRPQTMRASVDAGEVRTIDVTPMPIDERSIAKATGDLEPTLVDLQDRLYGLMGECEALAAELDLIDRVMPGLEDDGMPCGPLRPGNFLEGLETIVKRRRETLYALRVAEYERQLASDELDNARAHKRLQSDGDVDAPERVVVSVDASKATDATVTVTYTSGFATWRPYYSLRLEPESKCMVVVRLADVWQETEEDWSQCTLSLSTGTPAEGLALPVLTPWILERQHGPLAVGHDLYRGGVEPALLPPPLLAGENGAGRLIAGGFEDADEATTADLPLSDPLTRLPSEPPISFEDLPQPTPTPIQYAEEGQFTEITAPGGGGRAGPTATQRVEAWRSWRPSQRDAQGTEAGGRYLPSPQHPDRHRFVDEPPPAEASGGLIVEQTVNRLASVTSGQERHRLTLKNEEHPAYVTYLLRPALTDHAFGRVVMINDGHVPLLAGRGDLFLPGGFIGTVPVSTTRSGGKLSIELGAETSIKSKRDTRTSVRTEGLISKEDVHVVDVSIDIESFLDEPAQIDVQDQVPISNDAKVRVRLMKTEPRDARLDDVTGVITFDLQLAPRGRAQILLSYEIETPKGYRLSETLER